MKARRDDQLSDALLHKHTTSSSLDARLERILAANQCATQRPLSLDEALDLLTNSDDAPPPPLTATTFNTSTSIKDSVQLKIDSLKQYSSAVLETKEKTKTLLKVTGDSIKERFKQIQKQNRSAEIGAELRQYLPAPDSLLGNTRARGRREPMKVPRLRGITDDVTSSCSDGSDSSDYSMPPQTNVDHKTGLNLLRSKPRSQSLDAIPIVRDGEILMDDSMSRERPVQRTSSLTELFSFIGKKIVDLTGSGTSKDERVYKNGVTSYEFEARTDVVVTAELMTSQSNTDTAGESRAHAASQERGTNINSVRAIDQAVTEKSSEQIHNIDGGDDVKTSVAAEACTADDDGVDERVTTQQHNTANEASTVESKAAPVTSEVLPVLPRAAAADSTLSRTARVTRRFGASLMSAFDRLLVDPRRKAAAATSQTAAKQAPQVTSPNSNHLPHSQSANERLATATGGDVMDGGGVAAVKKSASATEFPKK